MWTMPSLWNVNARLLLAAALLPALGCQVGPFELPVATGWHQYRNDRLRVGFDVPDYFEVRELDDSATAFRVQGGNAVLLRWADKAEQERRGLWAGNAPLGACTLGGRNGQHFQYRHYDGPIYSVTDAYVVPHMGKDLALEFRTTRPSEVKRRMLASFHFLQ